METEAWYFTDWHVLEVRRQAGQVGYNEGRPNPLSSTKNAFTKIWAISGNRSGNIQALGLGLDWFEMSVLCFLSGKKANSYKPEFQFQVILSNREGFLDLGDTYYRYLIAKPFVSVEISCKVWIIIWTLCFYRSFSVLWWKEVRIQNEFRRFGSIENEPAIRFNNFSTTDQSSLFHFAA